LARLPDRLEAVKISEEMLPKKKRKRVAPAEKGQRAPDEMTELPKRLSEAIEAWEAEHKLKLSQHDLAGMTGLSQPMINKLQRGETLKGVAAASLLRIAKALDVDIAWFLTGVGAQPRRLPRYRVPEDESTTSDGAVAELHEPLTGPPTGPPHPPSPEQASRP
jgi:transcriptional regulator with XRE-family HTH domain